MHRLLRKLGNYFRPGKMGRFLNPNTYPDNTWYRQHLDRNFDAVFLGDANKVPKLHIPDGVKAFDWSLSGQNLQWDFNVIRQFFSILKPKGYVVFPLSDKFVDDLCHKVDESKYYMCIRPYFFSQSKYKTMYIRICKHIPLLAWRPKFMHQSNPVLGENRDKAYEMADKLISQICEFLTDRDLKCFFCLIINKDIDCKEKIISLFERKCCELKVIYSIDEYKWENMHFFNDGK